MMREWVLTKFPHCFGTGYWIKEQEAEREVRKLQSRVDDAVKDREYMAVQLDNARSSIRFLRLLSQKVADRMYKIIEGGCECDADYCVCGYNEAMKEWTELNAFLTTNE